MGKTSNSRASVKVKGVAESRLRTQKKRDHHGHGGPQALLTKETVRDFVDALMCPWCDKGPFKSLAGHTTIAHGIDGKELREAAGLPFSAVITAPDLHAYHVQQGKKRDMAKLRENLDPRGKRTLSEAAKEANRRKAAEYQHVAVAASVNRAKREYEKRLAEAEPIIREGIAEGKRFKDIAQEMGVSTALVGRYAKALGLDDGRSFPGHHKADIRKATKSYQEKMREQREADVHEWASSDKSWQTIEAMAADRGISEKSMRARLKKLGIDFGDGRSRPDRKRRTNYPSKRKNCEMRDCERKHVARGLCQYHYRQWRIDNGLVPKCGTDGCENPVIAKGLCTRHYDKARNNAAHPSKETNDDE